MKELKMPTIMNMFVWLKADIGDWYGYKYAGRLFRTQEELSP
ncbi:MAG: hypothetical protein ACLSDJ_03485 [Butyricimonas faecihominis]